MVQEGSEHPLGRPLWVLSILEFQECMAPILRYLALWMFVKRMSGLLPVRQEMEWFSFIKVTLLETSVDSVPLLSENLLEPAWFCWIGMWALPLNHTTPLPSP